MGFEELRSRVADCTPEWAAGICDVPAASIREAAEILGDADRLLSTVLQGVYQSHQATAAAVQVNNLHLLLGMLGRPGAGVLQMNGQPSAQNTRECGANGDLPGFRNWQNDEHVAELAKLWNVEVTTIPHFAPPTHAMQMFRYAEQGSIRMLWISGTNPAVSLPELSRIRSVLSQERLFTVVQDLFLTETAQLADVVLPAATWGEKTGTFTNAYPLQLITGRTLYHFHTRTKTGRVPQLNAAAPDVWVGMSATDADALGLSEGDLVEVATPRGRIRGRLRVTGVRDGVVSVPFHYG